MKNIINNGNLQNHSPDNQRQPDPLALYGLLVGQSKRYTMGDSSSVPMETAQELFLSIQFCISHYTSLSSADPSLPLALQWEQGIQDIWRITQHTESLFTFVRATGNCFGNLAYESTMEEVGGFFRRYDYRYFAHQIPCMIDYPLCRPVPESLQGIHYIREYLTRLAAENHLVTRFSPTRVEALLRACYSDYHGLLANLFEPVLLNAVGLVLLGRDPAPLSVDSSSLSQIQQLLGNKERAGGQITRAAVRLCGEMEITDTGASDYYSSCACMALPRIMATAPDCWRHIFLSLENGKNI